MSTMNRRTFMAGAAAVPVFFGLDRAFGQEAAVETPWLDDALKRMKATGRWGVVIVPTGDADARNALGRALYSMTELDDEDTDAHELFCQAVFIVLPAAAVKARFPNAGNGTRLLLDADGSLLNADQAGLEQYAPSANFAANFRKFIHGKDNAHLVKRAAAIQATLADDIVKAGNELDATDGELRAKAVMLLSRNIEPLTPWLAWMAQEGATEKIRDQARLLLNRYFSTLPRETEGARLPYGTYLPHFVFSCGRAIQAEEATFACGIGGICKRSGKFVAFLPKPPATK